MLALLKALWDQITLPGDDSPEAALGACHFSDDEIAAAGTVEVEDLDEDD